ncbi:hypothetical protein MGMO_8c00030 [Methyloglobulus morosus KoM1]|uniref:Uncharacterized protein n=1 Tax=Methyloglobulus morosus KoM1 TaxID=1116472 RepID=V5E2T1_9GAMM|nr:hypothetical protein MGMO_8c00030 [Methyloglobulus morosus KoM1]
MWVSGGSVLFTDMKPINISSADNLILPLITYHA